MKYLEVVIGGSSGVGEELKKRLTEARGNNAETIDISRNSNGSTIKKCITDLNVVDFIGWPRNEYEINIYFCQRYRGNDPLKEYRIHVIEPVRVVNMLLGSNYKIKSIIFLTSTCSVMPVENQGVMYHACRGAIESVVRKLAVDLGKKNVRVNGLALNTIMKNSNHEFYTKNKDIKNFYDCQTPLSHMGSAREVAGACLALTEDNCSFITGQIITVDGGLSLVNQENFKHAPK